MQFKSICKFFFLKKSLYFYSNNKWSAWKQLLWWRLTCSFPFLKFSLINKKWNHLNERKIKGFIIPLFLSFNSFFPQNLPKSPYKKGYCVLDNEPNHLLQMRTLVTYLIPSSPPLMRSSDKQKRNSNLISSPIITWVAKHGSS